MTTKAIPKSKEELLTKLQSEPQERIFEVRAENIDEENMTVELSFSSEAPYERWWGVEILDHKRKSVRMDRLNNAAAVLWCHNMGDQIGVVESAKIATKDRKGRAVLRFSKNHDPEEPRFGNKKFADIVDKILTKVSVGYFVHTIVLEKEEEGQSTYRVTDWEPYEISMVSVPADDAVGLGRSLPPELAEKLADKPQEDRSEEEPETPINLLIINV